METEYHTGAPPLHHRHAIPQSQPPEPSITASIFKQLSTYPFDSDLEFQSGLCTILGHPDVPITPEEAAQSQDLILQAQCFYFTRKQNLQTAIDASEYARWLQSRPPPPLPSTNGASAPTASSHPMTAVLQAQPTPSDSHPQQPDSSDIPVASSSSEQPSQTLAPYPSSFEHIVELITTGQPIPGIETIPDTLLSGQEGPSVKARRKKPWEKDASGAP